MPDEYAKCYFDNSSFIAGICLIDIDMSQVFSLLQSFDN